MKNKRKYLILLLIIIFINPIKIGAIDLMVNDEYIDEEIYKEKERTLVPVRSIFEKLGAQLEWDGDRKYIKAFYQDNIMELKIDDDIAYINGEKIKLDIPARLKNGKTLVPTRFVAEALGADVGWDQPSSTILINSDIRNINIRKKGSPYPYNLSPYDMKIAYEMGNKETIEIWNYLRNNYNILERKNSNNKYIESVSVLTPFHMLILETLSNKSIGKEFTLDDAKIEGRKLNNMYRENGLVNFDIKVLGDSDDYNDEIDIMMRQGDKYIRPFKITGKDKKPMVRGIEKDGPNFKLNISVSFIDTYTGKNKIDYSEPIELHIIPKKGLTNVYDFDPYRYR